MRLYVANATRQNQIINYRLDFDAKGQRHPTAQFQMHRSTPVIAPGRQTIVHGDIPKEAVDDIVAALSKVGMWPESELNRLPHNKVPYIFNVDKPVSAESIRLVDAHNHGVLVADGQRRREAAAISAKQVLDHAVADATDDPAAQPKGMTVEVEQEFVTEADEKRVEEGYNIVNKEAEVPSHVREKRARRA